MDSTADDMVYAPADTLVGGKHARSRSPSRSPKKSAKRARAAPSEYVVPIATVSRVLSASRGLHVTHGATGADTALAAVLTVVAKTLLRDAMAELRRNGKKHQLKTAHLQAALSNDAVYGSLSAATLRGAGVSGSTGINPALLPKKAVKKEGAKAKKARSPRKAAKKTKKTA